MSSKVEPTKVNQALFNQVLNLKKANPKISASGIAKMIKRSKRNRLSLSETTIQRILRCSTFEAYTLLLGNFKETQRLQEDVKALRSENDYLERRIAKGHKELWDKNFILKQKVIDQFNWLALLIILAVVEGLVIAAMICFG